MAEYARLSNQSRADELQRLSNEEAAAARAESKWKRTDIFKHNEKRKDASPMYFKPITAFYIFGVANLIAAIYSPIQDCDEVFNFWEPTHYLDHRYGFQTWEYSPEFAIRSWAYTGIHGLAIFFGRIGLLLSTKAFQFYFLRVVLGLICAVCESRLYSQISRSLNARIGLYFLLIMLTSPGMFHASVAYLPSSTTMYTTMLGVASFMDWRGGSNTPAGIMWIGLGSCLGWPFAGAMVIPFLAEETLIASYTGTKRDMGVRILYGTVRTMIFCAVQFATDLMFYRKYEFVPFNIVWYNIIAASEGKGPNIYGTEPWHFYLRNLILNFHIWILFALVAVPVLYYQEFTLKRPATKQSYIRNFACVSPFYLWFTIFTLQPHKEERFMYPAYPLIALNAAVSVHLLLTYLGSKGPSQMINRIPANLRFAFILSVAATAVVLGFLRTVGVMTAYSAPLSIYKPLHQPGMAKAGDFVCLGKEWYRFPGSYHLPRGVKGKFVRSEFKGLLPGEFSEAGKGFGIFPGAWLMPAGMNDANIEDVGKYTSISHCNFLVDSRLPSTRPTALEPDYIGDSNTWQEVECRPFLDTESTSFLARTLWVPDWEMIPERFRRKWGEYCLLKKIKQ